MNNTKKEKIALIGYGYWGKKLFRYLKESDKFHLEYVYFPSLKKKDIDSIHKEYGKEFIQEIETIWNDKDVKHVVIASPIGTHFSVTYEALKNNKNVLVEKPLAMTEEEACSLRTIAKNNNLCLMTEYTFTFSIALKKAQELVAAGSIGDIESIQIAIKQLGRFNGYDVFMLIGCHALSMLDLFVSLSELEFSVKPLMRTDDLITGGVVCFNKKDSSVNGDIDVTLHCPDREKKMTIYGAKGTLTYDIYAEDALVVETYSTDNLSDSGQENIQKKSFSFDEGHNLRLAIESFYDAACGKAESNVDRAVLITAVLEKLSTVCHPSEGGDPRDPGTSPGMTSQ